MRSRFESITGWRYSGEADLLLASAHRDPGEDLATLDFSQTIVLDLHLMMADNESLSIRRIFEDIFRFAESYSGDNPTWTFSDRKGAQSFWSSLADGIIESLPKAAHFLWKRGKHYRVIELKTNGEVRREC